MLKDEFLSMERTIYVQQWRHFLHIMNALKMAKFCTNLRQAGQKRGKGA
jgi:hypothetical protein